MPQNKQLFDKLFEADAIPRTVSKLTIPSVDEDGMVYTDENGQIVVAETLDVSQTDMFGANVRVMNKFLDIMKNVDTNSEVFDILAKENWKIATELVGNELAVEQFKRQ